MAMRSAVQQNGKTATNTDLPMANRKGTSKKKLIPRIHKPANLEFSFAALGPATPNRHFFVRNHFPVPKIDQRKWRLQVEGAVEKNLSLSLKDLDALPRVTHIAVLECAGNGRIFLPSVPEGVQWGLGAVGNASWTGVLLRDVLALAGVQTEAVEVVLQGADHGTPEKHLKPKNEIHFARSLPLSVAKRPHVLLAYEMNGAPLSSAHGAPLRLIVPGWYSVASVKWLSRIMVVNAPFRGYFQTVEYAYWEDDGANPPERIPITDLLVKSQISRPATHDRVSIGSTHKVCGAAWTAEGKIRTVEVSADGGKTWALAKLGDVPSEHGWQLWNWAWRPQSPGKCTLMSRATDSRGHTQPAEHNENYESYLIHHTLPISVEVV